MSKPLVSIVVPVYNVEKYITKCIESILGQTYRYFELILVDDGSPDKSGKIIDEYQRKNNRIKVIHQKNKGVASARNTGMDAANGEFLVFVDSDDWISCDHLEHLIELQKENDSDLCFTTEYFTKQSDKQPETIIKRKITNEEAAILLLSPKLVIGTYNKIYRRSWLVRNHIRQNEILFSGEGLNFIVTAAEYANHVTISNKKIYYYRRNVAESATTKFNIKMFTNNELSLDLLEKNKIIYSKEFDEMLDHFRIHLMISGLIAILNNSTPKEYPNEYNYWKKEIKKKSKIFLLSKNTELRYKIRILGAIYTPKIWAKMAKKKRKMKYQQSV